MKKHLPTILPALALLTLGGCASTSNLATTENDGMYYSSADKVTAVAVPVAQPVTGTPGDVPNPDYNGGTARRSGSSDEYYDDSDVNDYATTRSARFRRPYRGPSFGYYDFSYSDPFFYGAPVVVYSPYSPFGYSFYDPFYRPYYGYGGLTINIGFGYGFGRPYYRPYGYGYGYDPYYAYGSPWGGYYGNPYSYYNGYRHGYYNGYYSNGYYGTLAAPGRPNAIYGPRRSRVSDGAGLGNVAGTSSQATGRRVVQESGFNSGEASRRPAGRGRVQEVPTGVAASQSEPVRAFEGRTRETRVGQDASAAPATGTTRRWRVLDNASSGNSANSGYQPAQSAPGYYGGQPAGQPRRRVYSSESSAPASAGVEQPQRQRRFESAPAPTRTYEQPTRTYEQRPARSYEQPTRSYSEPSRSYSQPSRSYSSPAPAGGGGGGRGRVQ